MSSLLILVISLIRVFLLLSRSLLHGEKLDLFFESNLSMYYLVVGSVRVRLSVIVTLKYRCTLFCLSWSSAYQYLFKS